MKGMKHHGGGSHHTHTGAHSHAIPHMKGKHHKGHESHHKHNKMHGTPGGFNAPAHYEAGPQNPEGNESHKC